ncbi:unnamed protein product, partial [Iphiclides podalirius]
MINDDNQSASENRVIEIWRYTEQLLSVIQAMRLDPRNKVQYSASEDQKEIPLLRKFPSVDLAKCLQEASKPSVTNTPITAPASAINLKTDENDVQYVTNYVSRRKRGKKARPAETAAAPNVKVGETVTPAPNGRPAASRDPSRVSRASVATSRASSRASVFDSSREEMEVITASENDEPVTELEVAGPSSRPSSDDDGFTVVEGRKRRKAESGGLAKKQATNPTPQGRQNPRAKKQVPMDTSAPSAPAPKAPKAPPPVIIQDKEKWQTPRAESARFKTVAEGRLRGLPPAQPSSRNHLPQSITTPQPAIPAPSAQSGQQGGIDSDISLVCELAEKIDLAEISTLAYKIRSAKNIQERIRALADHAAVVEALKSAR